MGVVNVNGRTSERGAAVVRKAAVGVVKAESRCDSSGGGRGWWVSGHVEASMEPPPWSRCFFRTIGWH